MLNRRNADGEFLVIAGTAFIVGVASAFLSFLVAQPVLEPYGLGFGITADGVLQSIASAGAYLALIAATFLILAGAAPASAQGTTWKAAGKNGAVSSGPASADAGVSILKAGGNAADAAAATIFALSVTDGTLFCFGGEVPILVYDAKRGVAEVVCGLGTAPRLATM